MEHITKYYDRIEAIKEYKHHRQTWCRVAALFLCQMKYAVKPEKRLSCALTLAKMQVPLNGVCEYQPYNTSHKPGSFI